MIRRALGEAADSISRARLLGPYIEIVLASGDTSAAATAAEELRTVASELGTPLLRAHAARAAGVVLLAEANPTAALVKLRQAFTVLNTLGLRYDAARTRLLIAQACETLGDHDAAAIESSVANSTVVSLRAGLSTSSELTATSPAGLSDRELEVLRLLAQGKTNRVIAQQLVISEKTVASHVSHIFTKLGVTSRSAATAHAYDHNIV
jgi:DNA-binding NarL/FixJ family response regulator